MWINPIKYVLLFVILHHEAHGQRGLFWLGGMELGGTVGNFNYQQNKNVLVNGYSDGDNDKDDRVKSGAHFSVGTSLYYRFSRRFGMEAGVMNNHINVPLRDKLFQGSHKISEEVDDNKEGNFNPCINYTNKYFAAHYYFKDRYGVGIQGYVGGGLSINTSSSLSTKVHQSYTYQTSNEILNLDGSFTQNFYSPFIEAGFFFYSPYKKSKSFFGLKYSFAPILFRADYYNVQNSNILYQDHVDVNGSSLNVTFKTGIDLVKSGKLSMYRQSKKNSSHRQSKKHNKSSVNHSQSSTQTAERNVLHAELLGCFGYDKPSKSSFWIYHHKNRYFLEKLDSNLNRAFVEELNLESDESGLGKHDWVSIKNLAVTNKLTLFTSSGNSESSEIKITAHQYLLNGSEAKRPISVFRLMGVLKSYINIAWSSDSSKVCAVIFQPIQKKSKDAKVLIKTFDQNLNLLYSADLNLKSRDAMNPWQMGFDDLALNNKGEVFLLGESLEKNQISNYGIWMYNPESRKLTDVKFNNENVSCLKFKNNCKDEISIAGYYNESGKNSDSFPYKGILVGKINLTQMTVDNIKLTEVPNSNDAVRSRRVSKLKSVSLDNYKNHSSLLSENEYFIGLFHDFGSILSSTIDNDGNVKSISVIRKYQSHYGFGRTMPYSYFSFYNDHSKLLNVIFNDNKRNFLSPGGPGIKWMRNSRPRKIAPVLVSIDSLGNQVKQKLLPHDSTRTVWYPAFSFPINENWIFLMGKKSGKYRVTKIKIN